jgi:hypothetical protein
MRICINCNERFSGRSDKKFCSDYCRNQYNYGKSRYSEKDVLELHKKLRRNHRIISRVYESGCGEISLDVLCGIGYDLYFVTGVDLKTSELSLYDISFFIENNRLVFK